MEVAEGSEHLAPSAKQHGFRRWDVCIHLRLDLIHFDPAVRFICHFVGHHCCVIICQRVFAKAAPARVHAFHLQVKAQSTDSSITHREVAHFLTDRRDASNALVSERKRKLILHTREPSMQQLTVRAVT